VEAKDAYSQLLASAEESYRTLGRVPPVTVILFGEEAIVIPKFSGTWKEHIQRLGYMASVIEKTHGPCTGVGIVSSGWQTDAYRPPYQLRRRVATVLLQRVGEPVCCAIMQLPPPKETPKLWEETVTESVPPLEHFWSELQSKREEPPTPPLGPASRNVYTTFFGVN
jgi:hypothetical protein